jgi:predicted alpha/beta-hydrolase family hydrolase
MEISLEFIDIPMEGSRLRGFVHRCGASNADGLVLTHCAGSDCQSMLLRFLANVFVVSGLTVLRCDLPFRQARTHGPPAKGAAEQDQNGLRAAVTFMRRETAGRIFLCGHSYGGRKASMLAAGEPRLVEALLLLSYPLHPHSVRTIYEHCISPTYAHRPCSFMGRVMNLVRSQKWKRH